MSAKCPGDPWDLERKGKLVRVVPACTLLGRDSSYNKFQGSTETEFDNLESDLCLVTRFESWVSTERKNSGSDYYKLNAGRLCGLYLSGLYDKIQPTLSLIE